MWHDYTIDSLPSLGIADINRFLRTIDYNLSKIDSLPPDSWRYVHIPLHFWTKDFSGDIKRGRKLDVYLRKDGEGLYTEFEYSLLFNGKERDYSLRYYLVKRESNLIPGTYKYYFLNPYSEDERGDSLCSKLYISLNTGELLPREVLSSSGVLYSIQKKGHRERFYFAHISRTPPSESLRYRKRHYRGKETPFWRKYQELREREEERFIEFAVGKGWGTGILPPEVETEVLEDFYKHSRGKSHTEGRKRDRKKE